MKEQPEKSDCMCGRFLIGQEHMAQGGMKFDPLVQESSTDAKGRRAIVHHTPKRCRVAWIEGLGWRRGYEGDEWPRPWLANCPQSEAMTVKEMAAWYSEVT